MAKRALADDPRPARRQGSRSWTDHELIPTKTRAELSVGRRKNITDELPMAPAAPELTGKVLAIHGEQSLVEIDGELRRCHLSGRLKRRRDDVQPVERIAETWRRDTRQAHGRWVRPREQAPPSSPIAVGDEVLVRMSDHQTGMILDRSERRSWLGRLRLTKGPQVIAANVEIALVVMSVAQPEPNFFLLDQFLIQSGAGGLEPWIVFNKIDLLRTGDGGQEEQSGKASVTGLERVSDGGTNDGVGGTEDSNCSPTPETRYDEADFYRALGYPVFCTSAASREGLEELDSALKGRTAVFVGPSGVGKSTLLNDFIPKAEARIGEISEWSGRGQHTTTHVAMYPLPGGGYLVDAPGIRSLALWQVTPADVALHFPEFDSAAQDCEYAACAHLSEPGCAVRSAVESSAISARRYSHYCQLRQNA